MGRTGFCVDPPDLYKTSISVGGTKDASIEAIRRLKPTHIFTNHEENTKDLVESCCEIAKTLVTYPKKLDDIPELFLSMGNFIGDHNQKPILAPSSSLADFIKLKIQNIKKTAEKDQKAILMGQSSPIRFLYFIWKSPYMVVGKDTYINSAFELMGWHNAAKEISPDSRYPVIQRDELNRLNLDVVMFSTEPYPFRKRDASELKSKWPNCPRIIKVDGKLFSWFGSYSKILLSMLESVTLENNVSQSQRLTKFIEVFSLKNLD